MPPKKKEPAKPNEPQKTAGGSTAEDFEKLGVFYLGRPYDLAAKQAKPGWLLYDFEGSRDACGLRRHDG